MVIRNGNLASAFEEVNFVNSYYCQVRRDSNMISLTRGIKDIESL